MTCLLGFEAWAQIVQTPPFVVMRKGRSCSGVPRLFASHPGRMSYGRDCQAIQDVHIKNQAWYVSPSVEFMVDAISARQAHIFQVENAAKGSENGLEIQ